MKAPHSQLSYRGCSLQILPASKKVRQVGKNDGESQPYLGFPGTLFRTQNEALLGVGVFNSDGKSISFLGLPCVTEAIAACR